MLRTGRYNARFARDAVDVQMAQHLRHQCFKPDQGNGPLFDADAYDDLCKHVLITDNASGELVCCFRFMPVTAAQIDDCYSAQFYELSGLRDFSGSMVEMGRFCVRPDVKDPDVVRLAWAVMTKYVDEHNVEMLFGCSSFIGTDSGDYLDAFDMLAERHLAPPARLPKVKSPQVFRFAAERIRRPFDKKRAMRLMPPLLKTYLLMGGWVSDHAVVDTNLNTLHVFTGLEIKSIPPARARALRAVAG